MIKIRDVPNLTLGKADSGSRSNVAIGIEASATTDFELAISRINEEPKYQLVINNEGVTSNAANYGGIAFTQGAAATTVMASIKVDYTTTDGYPNLVFGTRSTSDALTILDDGSVSTNGRLDVNHDTVKLYNSANTNNTYFFAENTGAGNAGLKLKNSQGEFTIIANDRLRFISDDSPTLEVLSLLPNGKVGINSTNPNARLVVAGNSLAGDSTCSIHIIDNDSTVGSSVPNISFRSGASTQIYQIRANDTLGLTFRNSSDATKVTFDDDGNVGIGINENISAKLDVRGNANFEAANANITINATSSYPFINFEENGTIRFQQAYDVANDLAYFLCNQSGSEMWFGVNNAEVMRLSNGKVGIGTGSSTPEGNLEIKSNGSDAAGAHLRLTHANNDSTDIVSTIAFANNTGSVAHIRGGTTGANDNGYISFQTDNSGTTAERLRIDYDGQTYFYGQLNIPGGGGSTTNRLNFNYNSNNGVAEIAPNSIHGHTELKFSTCDSGTKSEAMRIHHDGKVGIGTGSSALTEELEVDGTVKATLFKGQFQGGGGAGGGGRAIFNAQDNIENGNLEIFTNGNTENGGDAVTFVTDNNTSSPYGKVARVDSLYEKQAVDFIPVQPGVALEGEIWYSIPSNDNGAQGSIFFGISRYDKDKKLISGNVGLSYFASQTQVKDSNWHKVSGNITLPTSHTPYNGSDGGPVRYIKPYVIVNYSGGTQAVSFGGMYIARRKAITIGATQTLGSETPGQLIAETNSFTRSSDLFTFNGKISQHLHEQQTGAGECNCWTLKDIDPLITYDSNNNPTSGFNITPETSNHDVAIIGSENQTPVLKINKEGLIVGFGVRNTVGTGSSGGVTAAKLVTSGELYTNATFGSQVEDNITPVNGKITLNLFLKDSAFASADHNHNASYGGSLAVGSGANANKIGLLAADGTTTLGSYITVPYATTAGSANGGAADTLSTIDSEVDADHYLTFVNSNNSSATYESFYTDGGIKYNPNKNKLTVDKIKCDTNLATAANTTTTALKHIIGKVDGGTVHYDFTDGQVKTFLGLGSMAYEATGNYYTKTAANTAFAAASHNHDSRYYTETEIDTKISTLNTSIGGKQATITGGATTITGSNLTASRALVSNSSGKVAVSDVTSTELGYLDGVTSAVQTQLNSLGASISTNATNISSNDTDISNLSTNKQDALGNTSSVSISDLTAVKTLTWPPACCPPDPQHTMNDVGIKAFSIAPYGTLSRPSFRQMPSTFRTVDGSVLGLHNSNALGYTVAWHWAYINNIQTVLPVLEMSDRREKENIEPIHLGLDFVNKLNPVSYHLKSAETPRKQLGLIADEVVEALDEYGEGIDKESIVYEIPKGSPNSRMAVGYTDLIAPLIKSVQELSAKVESLQSRIEELEK